VTLANCVDRSRPSFKLQCAEDRHNAQVRVVYQDAKKFASLHSQKTKMPSQNAPLSRDLCSRRPSDLNVSHDRCLAALTQFSVRTAATTTTTTTNKKQQEDDSTRYRKFPTLTYLQISFTSGLGSKRAMNFLPRLKMEFIIELFK